MDDGTRQAIDQVVRARRSIDVSLIAQFPNSF